MLPLDSLRGPMIVHDPQDPYAGKYDQEVVLTLSDWYHDQVATLLQSFISVTNPTGAEPVPDAALINDSQNVTFDVQPGKTYYFRMVNMGAFAGQYFWIEGHNMTVISVDGVYTDPLETDMIYLTAAQRYGVLVTARKDTKANFAMVSSMDTVGSRRIDAYKDQCSPVVVSLRRSPGHAELERHRLAGIRQGAAQPNPCARGRL